MVAPKCASCQIYRTEVENLQAFLADWCANLIAKLIRAPQQQQQLDEASSVTKVVQNGNTPSLMATNAMSANRRKVLGTTRNTSNNNSSNIFNNEQALALLNGSANSADAVAAIEMLAATTNNSNGSGNNVLMEKLLAAYGSSSSSSSPSPSGWQQQHEDSAGAIVNGIVNKVTTNKQPSINGDKLNRKMFSGVINDHRRALNDGHRSCGGNNSGASSGSNSPASRIRAIVNSLASSTTTNDANNTQTAIGASKGAATRKQTSPKPFAQQQRPPTSDNGSVDNNATTKTLPKLVHCPTTTATSASEHSASGSPQGVAVSTNGVASTSTLTAAINELNTLQERYYKQLMNTDVAMEDGTDSGDMKQEGDANNDSSDNMTANDTASTDQKSGIPATVLLERSDTTARSSGLSQEETTMEMIFHAAAGTDEVTARVAETSETAADATMESAWEVAAKTLKMDLSSGTLPSTSKEGSFSAEAFARSLANSSPPLSEGEFADLPPPTVTLIPNGKKKILKVTSPLPYQEKGRGGRRVGDPELAYVQSFVDSSEDGQEHRCTICDTVIRCRRSAAYTHVRRHLFEDRFACDYCGKKFWDVTTFNGHMRRIHNVDVTAGENPHESKSMVM